jgi:hypothetical protein
MNRQLNQMSGGREADFTPKQGQYLAFIAAYARLNRRPPAEADMQRYFGVTPPSVHQMVLTLERAGFIRRKPGTPRNIDSAVLTCRLMPDTSVPRRRRLTTKSQPLGRRYERQFAGKERMTPRFDRASLSEQVEAALRQEITLGRLRPARELAPPIT